MKSYETFVYEKNKSSCYIPRITMYSCFTTDLNEIYFQLSPGMRLISKVIIHAKYNRMAIIYQVILSNILELLVEVLVFYILLKLDVL